MPTVAVLIPCLNEERTVARVVRDFRRELPDADVYVFDNASTDRTAAEARRAGATVISEPRRGKGHVVQSMARLIEADVYVMVDGDGTYPPSAVHDLIGPALDGTADMVVGSRLLVEDSEFRAGNRLGNRAFVRLINTVFGHSLTDVFSGYRALTREAMKGLPLFVPGFEIETELTIKALERGYRIREVPVCLTPRPVDSPSKLRRVRDGLRILGTVAALARDYKPLTVFGGLGLLTVGAGLLSGLGVVVEYLRIGLVPRLPTAVLSVGLVVCGLLGVATGLVLHVVNRRFRELEHLTRVGPARPAQPRLRLHRAA
jgi:glycosyltransferase involved in cell wall biosynthesis